MYRISYMLLILLSTTTCLRSAHIIHNPLRAKVDRVCLLSNNKIAILYESAPEDSEKISMAVLESPLYAIKTMDISKPCGQTLLPTSFGRIGTESMAIGWQNGRFLFIYPDDMPTVYLSAHHYLGARAEGTLTKYFMDRERLFILHNNAMHMLGLQGCLCHTPKRYAAGTVILYQVGESYEYAALAGQAEDDHILALGQSHGDTQKVRLLRNGKCEYEVAVSGTLSGLLAAAQNTQCVVAMCSNNSAYVIDTCSGASRMLTLLPSLGAYSRPALLHSCGASLIYAAQQNEKGDRGLCIIEQKIDASSACSSTSLHAPGQYVQSILSYGACMLVQTNESVFQFLSKQKVNTEPAQQKKT